MILWKLWLIRLAELHHINITSLLQPLASRTRHIDGATSSSTNDNNKGNAFSEKDISLQQCSLFFCACRICFGTFSFQNDCQFLPFKVKAKQDKMDDPKKHEYKYLLCNFILSILPLLFSLKTSFLSAVFLSSISCSNIWEAKENACFYKVL